MASHVELNPDDNVLGLSLGMKAMRLALAQKTHKVGTVRIPTGGDTDVIIGDGAQDGANRIDRDGNQLPLVDTSGIDKAAQDARKAADDAAAKADEAIKQGEQIRRDAQAGIEDARKQAQAADTKAEQVRTDLTKQVQNVKSEMDSAVEAVQTSANKAQSAADAAQKAADKANASTADLDKSIKAVDAKAIAAKQSAAEAQSKAENVASDLDSANAVIEQHTTELGELTTKVSNAVKKSDSALSVSTEAKQTATEASTTASSAYKDSQTALTQSTTATQTATAAKTTAESASKTATDSLKQSSAAVQTANQISTTLRTEYQTKADADKLYATQSSLKQTSDSITASVSKTYATKDALSALQNVADNAIESWRGTGVPTLENKPASDWTTEADKKKHSGDLYYDKSTGKAYRFGSDDGVTYTWELNQDTDVTKALEDAANAQTSANNAQASATAANTAAGKAQSTANTAVSNAATAKNAADAAQSSANKAQGDVDKLKIDIPETYATKSSLSQTAESITANVESVKKTANSAVTAASKAQQTADGISVNLTKNYQTKSQADTLYATKASLKATSDSISAEVTKAQGTADGAVTAASKAQQTADAVTLNLSKNYQTKAQNDALYATQTSLKATSDSLSANITANAKKAQSAVDKATSLEANLNGFKTTVAETYQTKDGMSDYATNSSLTQTANSIKAQVTEVSKTANGAMSKATTVEQTANGLSTKITEQGKTLNATVKTANEAKSTADSNKATISQVSTTAGNALTKASTVEQNLNGFKTTVSETYTTKTDFNNLTIGGRNLLLKTGVPTVVTGSGAANQCVAYYSLAVGSLKNLPVGMYHMQFKIKSDTAGGTAYAQWGSEPWGLGRIIKVNIGTTEQTYSVDYYITDNNYPDAKQMSVRLDNAKGNVTIREMKLEKGTKPTNWSPAPEDLQPAGDYATNSSLSQTANQIRGEVSEKYQSKSGMSSYATTSALTQKADEITGKVTEVAKTATGAMGKASSVEQTASTLSSKLSETVRTLDSTVQTVNTVKSTADSNKATLTQVAKTASDASSRASSVEQSLNGFKTTVSQTYGRGSNLWVNPTFDPDKPQITSRVNNVTAPNGSGVNLLASRDHYNNATSFPVVPGHTYVITAHAKPVKGNLSLNAGIWYTKQTSGNAWDSIVHAESTSNLSDGWMAATWRFTCPDGKSRGCVYFQINQGAGNISTQWYVANVICVDVTGLQPAGDYATKSYVNQNAKTIALGVVENYKGSDGSGLATKSDITVAKKSITSTVASTYATKSGVTQEISSKITQNNNSLDVKFSTKVETQNAQNKANTADSHATNAQSRVGSLEDCINFTTSGVRVGKRSNGKFTGVSALVNTNGTFDLLDDSGNLLTRINRHRFQVTGDDGTGSGYLSLSQDGINITVQPTADTSKTYHIQVGKSGVGITAPDGSSIECSASGGLNIETVKYGKISIGAGGLQFTNDQGWGLRLSAAGWSLKWAGNHTLATGPAAGKLYIDGREIVTR